MVSGAHDRMCGPRSAALTYSATINSAPPCAHSTCAAIMETAGSTRSQE